MTREKFLKLQFPNLPYCEFNLKRGPSTKYNESWHFENKNTKKQLNIFWNEGDTVCISVFDGKQKDKFKTHERILFYDKTFTQQKLSQYCKNHFS